LAHKLAFACDAIRGDMVEVMEFPQLATKYGVMGVPKVVINETVQFEGALPEEMYVTHLMMAVKT
jgi:predicted DsbA family dithiol-disulfide isomerase